MSISGLKFHCWPVHKARAVTSTPNRNAVTTMKLKAALLVTIFRSKIFSFKNENNFSLEFRFFSIKYRTYVTLQTCLVIYGRDQLGTAEKVSRHFIEIEETFDILYSINKAHGRLVRLCSFIIQSEKNNRENNENIFNIGRLWYLCQKWLYSKSMILNRF